MGNNARARRVSAPSGLALNLALRGSSTALNLPSGEAVPPGNRRRGRKCSHPGSATPCAGGGHFVTFNCFALPLPVVGTNLIPDQREGQREAQNGTKCYITKCYI